MENIKKIFSDSLLQNHPQVTREIFTPAIKTVEKFAGVKFTYWAYTLFRKR